MLPAIRSIQAIRSMHLPGAWSVLHSQPRSRTPLAQRQARGQEGSSPEGRAHRCAQDSSGTPSIHAQELLPFQTHSGAVSVAASARRDSSNGKGGWFPEQGQDSSAAEPGLMPFQDSAFPGAAGCVPWCLEQLSSPRNCKAAPGFWTAVGLPRLMESRAALVIVTNICLLNTSCTA